MGLKKPRFASFLLWNFSLLDLILSSFICPNALLSLNTGLVTPCCWKCPLAVPLVGSFPTPFCATAPRGDYNMGTQAEPRLQVPACGWHASQHDGHAGLTTEEIGLKGGWGVEHLSYGWRARTLPSSILTHTLLSLQQTHITLHFPCSSLLCPGWLILVPLLSPMIIVSHKLSLQEFSLFSGW